MKCQVLFSLKNRHKNKNDVCCSGAEHLKATPADITRFNADWQSSGCRRHVPTRDMFKEIFCRDTAQLAFYVNLHRTVIGPSATLTGR